MSDRPPASSVIPLIEEHYQFLYRFACRLSGSSHDAEDLVQQTFLAAQRSLDQLREREKARAWLTAILRNAFKRSVKPKGAGPAVSLEGLPEPEGTFSADRPLDSEELQEALNRLPEEYRAAVVLFYLEELSYREIAEALEVPLGTVMSRLSRGKVVLRRMLHVEEPAEAGDDPADEAPVEVKSR